MYALSSFRLILKTENAEKNMKVYPKADEPPPLSNFKIGCS
jgi:hypothetical protein